MAEGNCDKELYVVKKSITFDADGKRSGWLDDLGIAPNRNYLCIAAVPTDWGATRMDFDKNGFLELISPSLANQTLIFTFILMKF